MGRSANSAPQQLHEYAELAQRVGFIQEIDGLELKRQFKVFQEEVAKTASSYAGKKDYKEEQNQHLLCDPAMQQKAPEVMALLASAVTRTSCEAVVEGMGSVAKRHKNGRGQLQEDSFNKGTCPFVLLVNTGCSQ